MFSTYQYYTTVRSKPMDFPALQLVFVKDKGRPQHSRRRTQGVQQQNHCQFYRGAASFRAVCQHSTKNKVRIERVSKWTMMLNATFRKTRGSGGGAMPCFASRSHSFSTGQESPVRSASLFILAFYHHTRAPILATEYRPWWSADPLSCGARWTSFGGITCRFNRDWRSTV